MVHKFLHIWQKIVEFGNVLIRVAADFAPPGNLSSARCFAFTFYLLPFTFYFSAPVYI